MDPVSIGLLIGGTAVSAYSQKKAGDQAKRIGAINAGSIERIALLNEQLIRQGTDTNAGILDYNARLSDAQAADAIARGYDLETRFRRDLRGVVGSQRVSYAAQGVEVDEGSALEVQEDTVYWGEVDALQIRVNAAREAWGYQVEAEDFRMRAHAMRENAKLQIQSLKETAKAEALSSRLGGQYASQAGTYGAVGTILGGAGEIYSKIQASRKG